MQSHHGCRRKSIAHVSMEDQRSQVQPAPTARGLEVERERERKGEKEERGGVHCGIALSSRVQPLVGGQ